MRRGRPDIPMTKSPAVQSYCTAPHGMLAVPHGVSATPQGGGGFIYLKNLYGLELLKNHF